MTEPKVFLSHASEDKASVAKPLADLLQDKGVEVWYDNFTLKLGDSLSKSINQGLANSRYGIVILSPNFFLKRLAATRVGRTRCKRDPR